MEPLASGGFAYDPDVRHQGVFVFPAGRMAPRGGYSWCPGTPRYLTFAATRLTGLPLASRYGAVVSWAYERGLAKGYYHPTGECPGHGGVRCDLSV